MKTNSHKTPYSFYLLFSLLLHVFFFSSTIHAAEIVDVNRLSFSNSSGLQGFISAIRVDGIPPWELNNWTVTAPDDSQDGPRYFNRWMSGISTSYNYQGGTWHSILDTLNTDTGSYTSHLTDYDETAITDKSIDFTFNELPAVNISTASPADKGFINTVEPTLTWSAVTDEDTTLFYQVEIQRMEDSEPFYLSDLIPSTSLDIPSGTLEDLHLYRWRVRVFDEATQQASSNFSFSDFNTFYVEISDEDPAISFCRAQSQKKEGKESTGRFVAAVTNIFPEDVVVLLKDSSGTLIHEFVMDNDNNSSGAFSWFPAQADAPPAGEYNFEVWNLAKDAQYGSACTATYSPDYDFAPEDEIFSPDYEATIPTETPTFSWMADADTSFYRITIMDYSLQVTVYTSPIAPDTTVEIPTDILKKNSAYRMRISFFDGTDATSDRGNRADTYWYPFFISSDAAPAHITGTAVNNCTNGEAVFVVALPTQSMFDNESLGWTMVTYPDQYTIYNLPMGEDIFVYALCDKDGDFEMSANDYQGWHSNAAIQLSSSGTTPNININLNDQLQSASISGTVTITDWDTGRGDIYIAVFREDDTEDDPLFLTSIESPGPFTVTGLAGGVQYSVGVLWDVDSSGSGEFTPGDATAFYTGNPFITADDNNPLGNISVEVGGVIKGHITDDAVTPNDISNLHVYFQDASTWNYIGGTNTDEDGNYIYDLPSGTYHVTACPGCDPNNPQPFAGETVSNITVAARDQITVNFELETGGIIEGTVTDSATSIPLPNHNVYFEDSTSGNFIDAVNTDGNGYYSIRLAPGSYDVRIGPSCADNTLGAQNLAVEVLTDQTQTSNFALAKGGILSGMIEDATGPLEGIQVNFENSTTHNWVDGTSTDINGEYCTVLPEAESYIVGACPSCTGAQFVDEIYPSAQSVTIGTPKEHIDFVLETGGEICGRITDGTDGIPGLWVYFTNADTQANIGGTMTDENGDYCYMVAPVNNYNVSACPSCDGHLYVDENYPTPVPVPTTSTVLINDIALEFPDGDGIDDQWELRYFESLDELTDTGDYDNDGFTDLQEYEFWQQGKTDSQGSEFDPTVPNASGVRFLPAIYQLLLFQESN